MKTETAPLDTKSPYEIATASRPDPRSDFDVVSDVVDTQLPEILELYQRLGFFEAKNNDTFSLQSVMEYMKEALRTGAEIERLHPGLIEKIENDTFPEELAKIQASRQTFSE